MVFNFSCKKKWLFLKCLFFPPLDVGKELTTYLWTCISENVSYYVCFIHSLYSVSSDLICNSQCGLGAAYVCLPCLQSLAYDSPPRNWRSSRQVIRAPASPLQFPDIPARQSVGECQCRGVVVRCVADG